MQFDPHSHLFTLIVHVVNAFLSSASEDNDIKAQIRSHIPPGSNVALAVVHGGAPTDSDIQQAIAVAEKIYNIMQSLGREGFAFQRSSYFEPLFVLGQPSNYVAIDVYYFAS